MNDYKDVANVYQAMVPPLTLKGLTTANPFMAQRIADLHDGGYVLDAACGAGWDAISINNGLPLLLDGKKTFNVSAADGSPYMVAAAKENVRNSSPNRTIDIRLSMIRDLPAQEDWRNRFDLVIVPNAINQMHEGMVYADYDGYLLETFRGLREVVAPSGSILVDSRDWTATVARQFKTTQRVNEHSNKTYLAEYVWTLGDKPNGPHLAEMTIWDNQKKRGTGFTEVIHFAGRDVDGLRQIFEQAGLSVTEQWSQVRGVNNEPFVTFALALG